MNAFPEAIEKSPKKKSVQALDGQKPSKMMFFLSKMSFLREFSIFVEKIEFIQIKTTQVDISPGGIKNSNKIEKRKNNLNLPKYHLENINLK